MALYNDYRPAELEEVYGNSSLKESLITAIEAEALSHTILLSGPSGCGKTTIARILADTLGTVDDIRELNISDTRGIEMARRIREMCRFKPLRSAARVVILNECHKATNEFQNAMLELLEEPPDHTYFILCTTEPEKLLKTVRNRCVEYKVESLSVQHLQDLITEVAEAEEGEISTKVIRRIAQHAEGSARAALTILEAVLAIEGESAQLEIVDSASAFEEFDIKFVCRTILNNGPWREVAKRLKDFNGEAESVRRAMLGYFSAVLLNPKGRQETQDLACYAIKELAHNFFDTGKAGLVAALYVIMHSE